MAKVALDSLTLVRHGDTPMESVLAPKSTSAQQHEPIPSTNFKYCADRTRSGHPGFQGRLGIRRFQSELRSSP